jgi:hypothetical protein
MFDDSWKVLVCSDDKTIDIQYIRTMTGCKYVKEIFEQQDFVYDTINFAFTLMRFVKKVRTVPKHYRMFYVDEITEDLYKIDPNNFLNLLIFNSETFDDLVLQNAVVYEIDRINNNVINFASTFHVRRNKINKKLNACFSSQRSRAMFKIKRLMTNHLY